MGKPALPALAVALVWVLGPLPNRAAADCPRLRRIEIVVHEHAPRPGHPGGAGSVHGKLVVRGRGIPGLFAPANAGKFYDYTVRLTVNGADWPVADSGESSEPGYNFW